MPPVAKNKTFDTSTEIENASVDFNTLCYPKENINTCNTSNESKYGKVISPQILVIMNHQTLTFPLGIFLKYCSI